MAELSPMTDTSTDGETDDKALGFHGGSHGLVVSDASDKSRDQKTLRRLAQNREAARKSRLRKRAYVQHFESSRMMLSQLEQELQRARQQVCLGEQSQSTSGDDHLQLLITQLELLTEQPLLAINNLQQTSQQAEDALSQGMDALQQSLSETLAGSLAPSGSSGNVANYMGQMAMAMGKLGTLEGFIKQADNLRKQTLQQMHRLLTKRQLLEHL